MLSIDGAGLDWSFMTDEEVPTDMALMAFSDSEFNKYEFNLATYKRGLASVEEQLVFYKKNKVLFYEQLVVLKRDISYKDSEISVLKSELEKLKQEKENNQLKIEKFDNASKSLDKLIGSQIPDKSRKGLGFVSYNVVPTPPTGLFSPPNLDLSNSGLEEFQQPEFEGYGPKTSKSVSEDTSNEVRESPDASLVEELVSNDKLEKKTVFPTIAKINFANCNYHQMERMVSENNYTRVNYNYSAKKAHPSAHRNIVPRAVLMKTGLRPLNTARPVNTAHPKTTVYSARPMSFNTAKGKVNTARPKAVNTARPNTAVVNAVRANQGHPQKEDQGYVDSGCSRHMTGNMSYLSDFKEFDKGYVTFGGGSKGGRITVTMLQTIVASSNTEAEYVAAASCCGQVLWIQNQMLDYGYNFMNTKIHIDNESTICIVKNLVFHSKTKHIEIRHHFIRDSNEKKLIQMIKIHTDHNITDLLAKAFDVGRFQYLIASIRMLNPEVLIEGRLFVLICSRFCTNDA
ncbi:hypothetical protein Tco_1395542 [Tanacetum coccineum]